MYPFGGLGAIQGGRLAKTASWAPIALAGPNFLYTYQPL